MRITQIGMKLDMITASPSIAAQVAHVLWIIHTHLTHLWESTPPIAFLSQESARGKSRPSTSEATEAT
jgi:hypothetical protein